MRVCVSLTLQQIPWNSSILVLTLQEKSWTLSSLKITQRNQWLTGPLFAKTKLNMKLWSGQVSFKILIVWYLSLYDKSVECLKRFYFLLWDDWIFQCPNWLSICSEVTTSAFLSIVTEDTVGAVWRLKLAIQLVFLLHPFVNAVILYVATAKIWELLNIMLYMLVEITLELEMWGSDSFADNFSVSQASFFTRTAIVLHHFWLVS